MFVATYYKERYFLRICSVRVHILHMLVDSVRLRVDLRDMIVLNASLLSVMYELTTKL
jgi:hypothetical protein